jgi:hypothetical protein
MKGSFTLLIPALLLCPRLLPAQTVTPYIINVTGSSAMNGYYRFDWSVGEMCIVDSYTKPGLILENGFLHTGTEKPPGADLVNFFAKGDIVIFPNPVFTITEVDFTLSQPGTVQLTLTDVTGRLVYTKQFDYNGAGRIEKLDLQRYPAGSYFLHVLLTSSDPSMPSRKATYKLVHLTR